MLLQRNFARYGLLMLGVVALLPMGAFGQNEAGEAISINNGYIGVSLYRSGNADSGIHTMWNVAGDPSSATDDDKPVLYFGALQLLSDVVTGDVDNLALGWATFEKGVNLGLWGDIESDGYWLIEPKILPGEQCIQSVWRPTPTETDFPLLIDCKEEIRLFHDVAQFKWTLTNNDLYDHQIGLKFWSDVIVEPFCTGVLNGDNVVSVPGYPLIEYRTLFPAKLAQDTRACPNIEFFNSQADPGQGVRAIFDINGATRPDVIGIDEYATLRSTGWSYMSDPLNLTAKPKVVWGYDLPENDIISNDVCYAAFWKPITLRPGQKKTIVHYIGNPASNISAVLPSVENPKYAAAASGPKTLKYYMDPGTGAETFGPSAFSVRAYLENHDRYADLRNCSFTLILPAGLSLDATETQYTKTIPGIVPNGEGSVSWLVKADGSRTGILTYYVAVNAYPMGGTIVKRDIHVPAISKQSLYYGWQQFSVPFSLIDANPATALGLDPGSLIKIFRYDPALPQNAPYYPYEEALNLNPGEAYWMKLSRPDATDMPIGNYTPIQWSGSAGELIPVHQGWNMIGNPYVYTVTAGELRFYSGSEGSLSYDEAIERLMISRTVWWWNTGFNTWNWSSQRTVQLKPWQGYWIKILDPRITDVMITPASQIGASIGGAPPPGGDGGDGGGPPPSP